jgi:hypothetical protein
LEFGGLIFDKSVQRSVVVVAGWLLNRLKL